jgi:P27 family predicted phage terminase small subunit
MAGRKPKPTNLKILEGNPGRRPLNKREPQPKRPTKTPRAPQHLSKEAQKEWRRVIKLLTTGIVTELDLTAVEAYCTCYAQWVEANGYVQEKGAIVKTKNGNPIQNPFLSVANRAMKEMRVWMAELGMTPSSRSRVIKIEEEADSDPLAALMNRAKANSGD